MRHLISATLTTAAIEQWQEWRKGTRSSTLSSLIESAGSFPRQLKALRIRVGHLLGILQIVRGYLASQLRLNPHLEEHIRGQFEDIIRAIDDETLGTIYHDPSGHELDLRWNRDEPDEWDGQSPRED